MKKENCCSIRAKINQCCRYNYSIIKNTSVKEILGKNDWLFNNSWNFWAYCRNSEFIKMPEARTNPIIEDQYILFSSTIHEFDDWSNIIDWDEYGTWYAYNFPIQKPKINEVLLLGNVWEVPVEIETNSALTNYFALGEEWQFIHDLRPDIFISKKGRDVIVGSTDFYTVWLINRNLN